MRKEGGGEEVECGDGEVSRQPGFQVTVQVEVWTSACHLW